MGIGQAPPRRYPPAGMLKSVLQALCEVNSFSVQEVIKTNLEQGQTLGEARSCCLIQCLPKQPPDGHRRRMWYFGRDRDGYVLVTACSAATMRVWPRDANGSALPVRLHRWILSVPRGGETLHSCDTPSCIQPSHISIGTHSENLRDAWRRGCRRRRRVPPSPTTTVQARLEPAPPLPTLGPKRAARESVFVLAGYGSPSKLARAQLHVQRCGTPAPVLIF